MIESRNGLHEAISPVSTEKTNELLPRLLVMLAEVFGKVERLHIEIERDGTRTVLDVSPIGELAEIETVREEEEPSDGTKDNAAREEEEPSDGTKDNAAESAIIKVLRDAERPLKANTIANRANYCPSAYFRQKVYNLARKSVIVSLPDHRYWLAERRLPIEFRTEQQ